MLSDTTLRLVIFVGVLLLMATLEAALPKRQRVQQRRQRWLTNLALAVINSVALKILGPVSALLAASHAAANGWGILQQLKLPFLVECLLAVIILDLAIYWQHRLMHRIPLLWRLHKMHHADRDIDVTTGIRFHPLEAVVSMAYKCSIVLLLGPAAVAVIIFEVLLNTSSLFNHANLRLHPKLDKSLRQLVVTPDFHRVHHSVIEGETNSNYGFFLSVWDRLFASYHAQPAATHTTMRIGLNEYQNDAPATVLWCLALPFKKTP